MRIEIIKFKTPKKLELHGLYLGKKNPETLYIFIHGLASSVFKKVDLYKPLVNRSSSVLVFNNRGSEIISRFSKIINKEKHQSKTIGSAHEKFVDCLDDINGAVVLAKKYKPKKIILLGHSTGCQKIVYYLSKANYDRKIKGAVLMSPISDLAGVKNFCSEKEYKKALNYSKSLVKNKLADQLLPKNIWPQYMDAQRFLSLYKEDSKEEIFTYSQKDTKSKTLRKIEIPLYILIGEDDKFLDRKALELELWFSHELKGKSYKIEIISQAGHSFKNFEKLVAKKIINYFKFI